MQWYDLYGIKDYKSDGDSSGGVEISFKNKI